MSTTIFEVGDLVELVERERGDEDHACWDDRHMGEIFTVTEINSEGHSDRYRVRKDDTTCATMFDYQLVLANKKVVNKKGKQAIVKKFNWTILKDSCNNHETTFNASEEQACNKLKTLGVGYTLYKLKNGFLRFNLVPEYLVKRKKSVKARPKKKPGKKVFKLAKKTRGRPRKVEE